MIEVDTSRWEQALAYIDQWVAYQQQSRDVPGAVVGIVRDTGPVHLQAFGHANVERGEGMRIDHIFRIASHSKTFTATAVMQLVETGRVRLDDPLSTHLPRLQSETWPGMITIRQLLSHASGITRDGHDANYWQLDRAFPHRAELWELVQSGEILPANERFKYSNIGYSLLGEIVEAASGVPFNDYTRREIIQRLGLKDTGPETDDHARHRLVTGYSRRILDIPAAPIDDVTTASMSPATGFYSTAADLCTYAAAHWFGDETLLSDASKREMQAPLWPIEQSEERYGLGFAVVKVGERTLVGHGGAFPGHATRTWFDPKEKVVVVVLTNQSGGPANILATGIVKVLDFAISQAPRTSEVNPQKFVGRFFNSWGITDVVDFGGNLFMLSPDADDPVKEPTELEIVDENTLRIVRTGGYASPGQVVAYEFDNAGRVTRMDDAGISSYPEDVFRTRIQR